MHIDSDDCNKKERIPGKTYVSSTRIYDYGDWINYDRFLTLLKEGHQEVRDKKRFNDRPVYIFFMEDDDDLYVEFWGEEMESDEDFEDRLKRIELSERTQDERDYQDLKLRADKLGYDVIKKS
jgi:heat shock protein HspQ